MCMADLPQGAYERAFGHSSARIAGGREVHRFGSVRRHDSVNIRSVSMGVMPDQAEEFTREYGRPEEVRFDRRTGEAVFRDRRAKLRYMRAAGFHDRDEVAG